MQVGHVSEGSCIYLYAIILHGDTGVIGSLVVLCFVDTVPSCTDVQQSSVLLYMT